MVKTNEKDSTEERIMAAAHNIFTQKGMSGARMQEIADEAGINKALLHYYFRNKEMLFRRVFESAFQELIGEVSQEINSDKPLFEKIRSVIDLYMDGLSKNPSLPIFVLSEINQNPTRFEKIVGSKIPEFLPKFFSQIEEEVKAGRIIPINPVQLMLNILSMVIFPFAAKPLLDKVVSDNFHFTVDQVFEERKAAIYDFVVQALTKK